MALKNIPKHMECFTAGGDLHGTMEQQRSAIQSQCHSGEGHVVSRWASTWRRPAHEARPPYWSIMHVGSMFKQREKKEKKTIPLKSTPHISTLPGTWVAFLLSVSAQLSSV